VITTAADYPAETDACMNPLREYIAGEIFQAASSS